MLASFPASLQFLLSYVGFTFLLTPQTWGIYVLGSIPTCILASSGLCIWNVLLGSIHCNPGQQTHWLHPPSLEHPLLLPNTNAELIHFPGPPEISCIESWITHPTLQLSKTASDENEAKVERAHWTTTILVQKQDRSCWHHSLGPSVKMPLSCFCFCYGFSLQIWALTQIKQLLFSIVLKYIWCKLGHFNHVKCTIHWHQLSSPYGATITTLHFWNLHHPKRKLCTHEAVTPHSSLLPIPSSLVTSNLFSVSMNLPIQAVSYKWNPITFVLCARLISLSIIFSRAMLL